MPKSQIKSANISRVEICQEALRALHEVVLDPDTSSSRTGIGMSMPCPRAAWMRPAVACSGVLGADMAARFSCAMAAACTVSSTNER